MAKDVGIPGIAPEDVKLTLEQQAQIDRFKADMKAEAEEPEVELYESEINAVVELLNDLQFKYGYRRASCENLASLKSEAEDRFEELGLLVSVDWIMSGLSVEPTPPTITIVGRLTEFNPEQNRFEVGAGVADDYYKAKQEKMNKMKKAQAKSGSKLILPGQ